MNERDEREERELREILAMLQKSYNDAAKPYIDRLVMLHMRNIPPMFVTLRQAQELGLMLKPNKAEAMLK